jgi:large subunit ribosomal protein L23
MAFFKRSKNTEEKKEKETKAKTVKAPSAEKSEEKAVEKVSAKAAAAKPVAPKDSTAYRVLVRPIVSEKSARLEKNRQFAFAVAPGANKVEIKKAVEKHYRVHVTGVNVVNVGGKYVNRGRVTGKRKDWRKAYVTVKEGENITF